MIKSVTLVSVENWHDGVRRELRDYVLDFSELETICVELSPDDIDTDIYCYISYLWRYDKERGRDIND